jgi:hypothetical protein
VDVTLQFSKKASKHAELKQKFTELAQEILSREPTPDNLRWARTERVRIERDEPPVRRLVDLQAMNDEYRSRGMPEDHLIPLDRWQRLLAFYFPEFGMTRLERWRAERDATRGTGQ